MARRGRRIGKILVVLALLATPVAAHVAVVQPVWAWLAGPLVAVQAGFVSWAALGFCRRGLRVSSALAVSVATLLVWRMSGDGLMMAAAVPHAVAYLGLLGLFVASLAPGREPVISVVARRARGPLNAELQRYTRNVTIAWCVFFAAQLATSALLWLLAPLSWWSVFVNLCTLPLVVLMFVCELLFRHFRHGIYRPAGSGSLFALRQIFQVRSL